MTLKPQSDDRIFCVRENGVAVWRCMVAGKVHGDWLDRGAALAGLKTEQDRHARRQSASFQPTTAA